MNKNYSFDTTVLNAIENVGKSLSKIPQLQEIIDIINNEIFGRLVFFLTDESRESQSETLRYITKTYFSYLRIVKDLGNLSNEDLEIIRKANQICVENGISSNSAFNHGADHFLKILGDDYAKMLVDDLFVYMHPRYYLNEVALNDLADRMQKGSELAASGTQVRDGASQEVDYAIWGHTRGLTNQATIHFVIVHFLERIFTAIYNKYSGYYYEGITEMVQHKDTLISALGNVIYLRTAQGRMDPEISQMWLSDRSEGGLKWNRQAKQDIYNQLVGA